MIPLVVVDDSRASPKVITSQFVKHKWYDYVEVLVKKCTSIHGHDVRFRAAGAGTNQK